MVSLVIGATATVGVAWGCAWRASSASFGRSMVQDFGAEEGDAPRIRVGVSGIDVGMFEVLHLRCEGQSGSGMSDRLRSLLEREYRARIPWWSTPLLIESFQEHVTDASAPVDFELEVGAGWPWVTMTGWTTWRGPRSSTRVDVQGIVLKVNGVERILLPTRPAWRGFIASTVLFATLAMPVPLIVGRDRAQRRRKAGACMACGYDMAGVPCAVDGVRMCPECGTESRAERAGVA